MSHIIELHLIGDGMRPGNVRSKEVGELLEAFEDAVASVLAKNENISKEKITVGIESVVESSLSLRFDSPQREPVLRAFEHLSTAIRTENYRSLPNSARRSLSRIVAFSARHRCRAEFVDSRFNDPVAVIDSSSLVADPELVYGGTTLFGRVIRVGGRRPRVMVELLDGTSIYCDTSSRIAKVLALKLYEHVRLEGQAAWDPDDWSLVEFLISDAAEAPVITADAAMKELSAAIGSYFADSSDVVLTVSQIRRGEED